MSDSLNSTWVNIGNKKVFSVKHRVRYSDTDRMDMVYHGSYVPMLEAARVDTLREIGWIYSEMEKKGILLPVIDLNLKYKKPARYDQILSIESHVLTPPTSKLIFVFKIKRENELLVEAQVTLAFVNASTGLPQRAPDGLCADLEKNGLIHSC